MVDSPKPFDRPMKDQPQAGVGLALHKRTGGLFVTGLVDGSPAHKSEIEILPGDVLASVDGVQVGSDLEKAKAMIKGVSGSKVCLELVRGTRKMQVNLRRGSTVPTGTPATPSNKVKPGTPKTDATPGERKRNRPMRRSNTDIPGMLKAAAGLGLPEGSVYEDGEVVQMAEDCVTLLLEQERVSLEYGSEVEMKPFRKPAHPIGRWARKQAAVLKTKVSEMLRTREEGKEVSEGEVRGLLREVNDKISLGVQHLLYCLEAEEVDEETRLHLWVVVEEHVYAEIGAGLSTFFALEVQSQEEALRAAYANLAEVTPSEMLNRRNSASGPVSPASEGSEGSEDVSEARRRYEGAIRVAREVEDCGACPVSRLLILERCCRRVSAVLQRTSRRGDGGDEFLPALLFVLLQARVDGLCGTRQLMSAAMASLKPSASLVYTLSSLSTLLDRVAAPNSPGGGRSGVVGGWDALAAAMAQENNNSSSSNQGKGCSGSGSSNQGGTPQGSPDGVHARRLWVPGSPLDSGCTPSPLSPPSISLSVSSPLPPLKSHAQRLQIRGHGALSAVGATPAAMPDYLAARSPRAAQQAGPVGAGGEQGWRDDVWYAYEDDESGLPYYFNPTTQETEWELPPNAEVRRASMAVSATSPETDDGTPPTPINPWQQRHLQEHHHHHHHHHHHQQQQQQPGSSGPLREGLQLAAAQEEGSARHGGALSMERRAPAIVQGVRVEQPQAPQPSRLESADAPGYASPSPPTRIGGGSDESLVDLVQGATASGGQGKAGGTWEVEKATLQRALEEMIKATKESSFLAMKVKEELRRERRRAEGQEDMIRALLREKKALRALLKRSDEEVGRKEEALERSRRELRARTLASHSPSDSASSRAPPSLSPASRSGGAAGVSPTSYSIAGSGASMAASAVSVDGSSLSVAGSSVSPEDPRTLLGLRSHTESYSIEGSSSPDLPSSKIEPQRSHPAILQPDPTRSPDPIRAERRPMLSPPAPSPRHSVELRGGRAEEDRRPTGVGLTFQEDYSYQPSPARVHGLQATNTHKRPAWRVRSIKTGYERMIAGKVLVGDVLASIDGESCFGLSRYDLGMKAVGPEGSKCELVIIRPRGSTASAEEQGEDKITVTLVRRRPQAVRVEREGPQHAAESPSLPMEGTEC